MTQSQDPFEHDQSTLRAKLADVEAALEAAGDYRDHRLNSDARNAIEALIRRRDELQAMLIPEQLAVTLPIDVVEALIRAAQIPHPGNLKPRDREMLEIAEKEVESVRRMVGR